MSTMLDAALQLAALGYHGLPLHIVEDGQCSCDDPDCRTPGKHPNTRLCPSGHLDATTDHAVIIQHWALYPDANIGVALKASGLVVVAPDCAERLADFERRGLPPTMIVQSGSGEGHRHYYYQRPAGCPELRICRSQDFDLLSDGYVVAPPSVTSGPYVLLTDLLAVEDLPLAPAWAVAVLTEEQKRRDARPMLDAGDDSEPPVRIPPEARKRWDGVYFTVKGAGQVNRSTSLYIIAKDLARAGATPRTIARALLERDATLGWKKYATRADGAARALKDAIKATAEVAAEPTVTFNARPNASEPATASADLTACQDAVAALRRELAEERRTKQHILDRNAYLEERISQVMSVLSNPGLKPAEALVALNVVSALEAKAATGQTEDGWARVRLDELAKPTHTYVNPETGEIIETRQYNPPGCERMDDDKGRRSVSKPTISRYLEKFEDWDMVERRYEDHYGGQGGPMTDLYLRLKQPAGATIERLTTMEPEREKRHGGSLPKDQRPVICPEHPDADIIVRRSAECAECHAPLGQLLDEVFPANGVPFHVETGSPLASTVVVDVPMTPNLKRADARDVQPIQHETAPLVPSTPLQTINLPLPCPNGDRPLIDLADRALGWHDYRCNLSAAPPPRAYPSPTIPGYPTAGGGSDD